MWPPEPDTRAATKPPAEESSVDPFTDVAGGQVGTRVSELLGAAQHATVGMLEAEDALQLLRERFEQTEEPEAEGDLAADALEQVELQLRLIRERRQGLDSIEGKLWNRRNRLERFLISKRGAAWWRARRDPARLQSRAHKRT
jgi:hypothetical protein